MDEIRNFWGDMLQPIAADALMLIALPDETRQLLMEVGVPQDPRLIEDFGMGIDFKPAEAEAVEHDGVYYLMLGVHTRDAANLRIGIKAGEGTVHLLNLSASRLKRHRRPDAFINTTFKQFLLCTVRWAGHKDEVTDFITRTDAMTTQVEAGEMSADEMTDALREYNTEGAKLIETILAELRAIDAPALNAPDDPKKVPYWYDLVAGVAPD